jgi:hypothetical protein
MDYKTDYVMFRPLVTKDTTADAFARLAAAANEKIQASWKDRPVAPPAETTRLVASSSACSSAWSRPALAAARPSAGTFTT